MFWAIFAGVLLAYAVATTLGAAGIVVLVVIAMATIYRPARH
jgi:ABC-type uncharacterized transport system permease subunit